MAETYQFGLPLVAGAQAQKHVTVNESIALLDAVTQLRVITASQVTPPISVQDGSAYRVPAGATDAWVGHEGEIAVGVNGGWRFVTPKTGWQVYNEDTATHQVFDGTVWLDCALAASLSGAAIQYKIAEIDHIISAGATSTTSNVIPNGAQVIGVTGRVLQTLTGTLSSWELGVSGSTNRYGSNLGLLQNSFAMGLSGAPVSYYADTPLLLTATGGDFASGEIRLAVHMMTLVPPRPV